jgi:RNA polymerase sigma-70 factor, ECF subfamily
MKLPTAISPCAWRRDESRRERAPSWATRRTTGPGTTGYDFDAAFDELVLRYQTRVAGLAYRLLGWSEGLDDVVQEVFLRVLGSHAEFRGQSSLWTFLAAITVNCCRATLRRRWLRNKWERFHRETETSAAPGSDWETIRGETAAQVRAAVRQLPAKYREVIVLRYLEELSVDDVAATLSLSRNAVEV